MKDFPHLKDSDNQRDDSSCFRFQEKPAFGNVSLKKGLRSDTGTAEQSAERRQIHGRVSTRNRFVYMYLYSLKRIQNIGWVAELDEDFPDLSHPLPSPCLSSDRVGVGKGGKGKEVTSFQGCLSQFFHLAIAFPFIVVCFNSRTKSGEIGAPCESDSRNLRTSFASNVYKFLVSSSSLFITLLFGFIIGIV